MLETVIVLNWKISANAQPQYEVCFVTHFNLVPGLIQTFYTVEKPPTAKRNADRGTVLPRCAVKRKQMGAVGRRDS